MSEFMILAIVFISMLVLFYFLWVNGYMILNAKGAFITDMSYWAGIIVAAFLFSGVMVVVRSMRKSDSIKDNEYLQGIYKQIQKSYKFIENNGYAEKLEQYIKETNEQAKYEQFLRNCDNVIYNTKNDKKRQKYIALRKTARDEVLKMNVHYKKISFNGLFAGLNGKIYNDNENDISTHETADVSGMVGKKTMCLILLTAFTGTIVPDFFAVGISAIYTTLLKIFSMCIAVATAVGTADNFVENNVLIALQRRYNHITRFVNKNPEIMGKIQELKIDLSLQDDKK